jgi:hypothetical protein
MRPLPWHAQRRLVGGSGRALQAAQCSRLSGVVILSAMCLLHDCAWDSPGRGIPQADRSPGEPSIPCARCMAR